MKKKKPAKKARVFANFRIILIFVVVVVVAFTPSGLKLAALAAAAVVVVGVVAVAVVRAAVLRLLSGFSCPRRRPQALLLLLPVPVLSLHRPAVVPSPVLLRVLPSLPSPEAL